MANNNKLFLRELSSPYGDISRNRTLSFKDLDSNFIFLKGECINSMSIEDGNVILNKISGENMYIPISGISESIDSVTEDMISDLDSSLRKDIEDNKIWVWGSEGYKSVRVNNNSGTDATGDMSHAEGSNTTASGRASHAGGASSYANGDFSFAHSKESKADGESSVVLGGNLNGVEGGGENSGVFAGDTNRILGLDYQKLISDTENEIPRLEDKRAKENANYEQLQNDLSEEIEKKQSEIDILNDEIKDIEAEINSLKLKLNALNNQNQINLVLHQELTSAIASLENKLQEKLQAISSLTYEIGALQFEIESSTDIESESQQKYDEERERLENLLDEYNQKLYDFDGYLPKQSTILGGSSNIINSASESIINGGSGNTISSKVKNSGIFGGSKNELGGGDYIDLIARLLEEASQRAEEKAKYDYDTVKLIMSLESSIHDKEQQLESEKQQQPQDLGLIATLEVEIVELKEEKKVLEEELSRNNADYETYVQETEKKIEEYKSKMFFDGENFTSTITPIDNSSIIAGSGNKIIHLSDNSSIIGGKSNLIDNASGSVILGGEGITATNNNTVYTPNLNIDIQPANDNSLTQVLVRDGDGNVKYKDVASFTDLSVVSGVYDIRTGIVTLINNDGNSFEISGFTSGMTDSYTTEAYLEDKTIYFNNNIKGDDIYSVDISPILNDVIASIGLNDNRGTCSVGKYVEYTTKVQEYYDSKELYDEYDSNIKTLTDEITQLNSDIDILKSDLEFKFTDLIYTQITGGSVEELQIIINQKEADLNSKQAELEQKEVEREGDIKRQEEIIDSGALEFAPYVPANEANFNCWSEQQIIDSVGYDDRGNCSGDRYKKYLSEYNSALEYFNTSPPLAPPSFKDEDILSDTITYNNLSTERQKLVDYWVEHTTYTNNLISSYVLEISKYQTILDTLNAIAEPTQSQQDEIEGLVKIIPLLENRKSELESEYAVEEKLYINLIDWFDHNLSYLESTDEYNFIQQYTPINEVNFNCWNDSEDYNDLNAQITGITSAVGYDDRGTCSEEQYASYESEVQLYYDSKELYDQYDSNIKTLTDEINQLNDDLLNASTQQESDAISINIEQKQVQRQSYVNARQQIIDSGDLEFAPYVPANEANFNCWRNDLLDDKIDTKTDLSLFKSYTSSTETVITGITSTIGYNDRGSCSEEQYTSYEHEVNHYYSSKESYDEYDSNIKTLTDEITELTSDIDTLKIDLEFKTTDLMYTQITGGSVEELQIIISQKEADLDSKWVNLEKKQVQKQSYVNARQKIIDSGDLEFAPYVPANEANFNCWSEQQIIDSVGYDNRGNCSGDRYEKYISEYNDALDYYNTEALPSEIPSYSDTFGFGFREGITYNKLSTERQRLVDYWQQISTDTNNLISSYDLEITKYQTIIDSEEDQSKIDELNEIIILLEDRKRQVQEPISEWEESYNMLILFLDTIQTELENTDAYNFIQQYTPINEVNFNCWNDSKDYNDLHSQITGITSTIGYNDRGSCSEEQYTIYKSEVQLYYDSKEVYDQYDSNIKPLTDEITQLNADIDTLKTEINTLERTITIGKLDGIDQTDNQNLKIQKEADLDTKWVNLEQKQVQKQSYVNARQQIIDSGALDFVSYVPANEANFNCWSEQQVIDSVGYDDRGTCDNHTYKIYQKLVEQLETSQIDYNEMIKFFNEAKEVRRFEYNNFLKEHALISENIDFYQVVLNQINQTIQNEDRDATPEELMKIAILEQVINDFIREKEEVETAEKAAKEAYEALKRAYDEQIDDFENNIKPDIDRYLPANEVNYNCWRNEYFYEVAKSGRDVIISNVGYNDRGECSEEQYATYESEVNHYYSSKEVYDEYDSNIKTLTDEITVLESSKTTKESELSTKQNELVSIKPGSDFIIENAQFIFTVNQELNQEIETIRQSIQGWVYGETEAGFFAKKTAVEADIASSIDKWNILNDLMVVNTTFNYQNKGSITTALTNIKNSLDITQTILGTMVYTDTEEVFLQNKTDIVNHVDSAIQSTHKIDSDVGLSIGYYEQTNNDLQNEIQQLQQEIDTINANIEQKQVQRQSYIDSKQQIIDSGALEFEPYVPANEANFNCYINSLQNDKIDTKTDLSLFNSYTSSTETTISAITSTIGIGDNDRGICSKDRFVEYIDASVYYYDSKELYDQYDSNIQTLTDEITQLNTDIDTLKTELNTLERTITIGKLDGIDQTDNKNLKDQKVSDLLAKLSQLRKKIDDKEKYVADRQQIIDSGALDFAPYAPVNEVNFNCWENNELNKITRHVSDSLGVGHRGSCDAKPYNIYLGLVNDLEAHQSQNNFYVNDRNGLTQDRNLEHQNYTKERAVITDNIAFYQDVLNQINQTIQNEGRDATSEELGKIAILELLINDLQTELNALDVAENSSVDLYNEAIANYNEQIDHFENNIKPDIDKYLPANEVNYNCWRNELFFNNLDTRIQTIKNEVDCQIYDIESSLIDSNLPGTFNYYPNLYDDFSENPKFIIGEFDDLDNIINLDEGSKISWAGSLFYFEVASITSTNPENYKQLFNNLTQSIWCLEYLLSKINSIENEKNAEFDKVKSDIDGGLDVLDLLSRDDIPLYVENIDKSGLEQRKQNLIDERNEEIQKFEYRVQKIEAALNVYEEIKYRSEVLLSNYQGNPLP